MNEFLKPNRNASAAPKNTAYAEPEKTDNIRIVVDNTPPYFKTEEVKKINLDKRPDVSGVIQAAADYGSRLAEEFNPINGGFNTNLKNRTVSLALCAVLGIFGAHRFYEGKIATGILWACTVGCFGIGWLTDLIILINKPKYYEP